MATPNEPLGPSISDSEARDIASAIAASLDTAQVGPGHVYNAGNWEPMTSEQHKTQRRQIEALKDAENLKEFPDFKKAVQASLEDSKRRMSSAEAGGDSPGKIDHPLPAQHDPWRLVDSAGLAQAVTMQTTDSEDKKDPNHIKRQIDSSGEESSPSYAPLPVTSK